MLLTIGPVKRTSAIRCHHLLKTFWNDATGWRDRQLRDGTVVWTSPTGHTYVTYPGSKHLFPTLCQPTATLWAGEPPVVESAGGRGAMMPRRRHTRAHNKAKTITAERKLNDAYAAVPIAERNEPPPF
jgi:hypothetical protein